ncbi:major capsid protein [Cupriavidus campinensis]|uniref:Phage major capsid protein n=1 Tax=Cupriavidus campinensis TaxID=151783 RepID=A0ABY3ETB8_9BURK|nr:phage major capsid protein [Cupriavidus campinensis]TSP13947.1 phage major capsid protein [Cupriavidus campinensis]
MPLLRVEAERLSNNQLVAGIIEEIIERDDLFAILPFTGINGKAYVYNRENTLAGASWLDPNDVVPEEASTFQEVVAKLRILAGDVDIDKFLQATMSDTNSQIVTQLAAKAKGVAREFHRTLMLGDSATNAKEFDGLPKLVSGSQTISAGANGGSLTLAMLDELCDAVPKGADVLMMRRGTIRAYRNLLRATSGTDAVMQMLDNFGRPMLTHNGVPIIMNEFSPGTEDQGTATDTCSVYALRLNELDGLHGIYGGGNAGIVVENLGTVQNKDATRIRMKWYTGLALKSTKSVARLKGVTNI